MLLGGMSVIGAYLWASEASFKATSPAVLSQVYMFKWFSLMLMLWFNQSAGGSTFSCQAPLAHAMLSRAWT